MGKLTKKNPYRGACGETDKEDKRKANRKLRRLTKEALKVDNESLPVLREVSDPWDMNKDGKVRFDPDEHPDLMRK